MKVNRFELAGILASIVLVLLAGVFALSQTAYAETDPCSLPGMGMLGCDDNQGDTVVPVDPCEITPCDTNEPSLAEEITCDVYEELMAQGEPIPEGFDASGCGDNGGGSGGGGETPACSDGVDNDNDGATDSADPGCTDANDNDETNTSGGGGGGGGGGGFPACSDGIDNDGDGKADRDDPGCSGPGDIDEADSSGGGGGGGGSGGGSGGSVAGSATSTCDRYLTDFIKFGGNNNAEQVKRLQHVLKAYEGADVEESGDFDQATLSAVHAFQTKYWDTILAPWNIKASTGFVYLTTRKKVNEIYCKNEVMFPLSDEENALIESTKKPMVAGAAAEAVTPAPKPVEKPAATEKKKVEKPAVTTNEAVTSSPLRNFFRRLFNWGR